MALQFLDEKGGGVDFGQGIINTHPQLKGIRSLTEKERKKMINEYFNDYYKKNRAKLLKKLALLKTVWRKKEASYFKITKELFDGFEPQKGMHICYLSIIDCNPRFLDSKCFQTFYGKDISDAIHSIAHEILHFFFYDFLDKKLKKESGKLSEDKIWDLSEIFNVVVLESEKYYDIIDKKVIISYPDHKKHLPKFRKFFKESKNIQDFIIKGLHELK